MTSFTRGTAAALLALFFLLASARHAHAIPAFARKYGLRCSACHEAWPMLNYFGQKFKDNGYQLMNDRDSPVWQNPSYWPVTFRMTPVWHRESTDKITYDTPGGGSALRRLSISGFDYGGLDNVFHSPWLNFKFGKFELDNIVSEKRSLTLSASGGPYQIYHFIPVGNGN